MNTVVWITQILLALAFLMFGATKALVTLPQNGFFRNSCDFKAGRSFACVADRAWPVHTFVA
jgi:hypothetical protein